MAFYNNDISGNYELNKAVNIMKQFGQLSVSQARDLFNLNDAEARVIMHRAYNNRLVREVQKDKYVLNCAGESSYSHKMEYALNLAILMCKGNEGLNFEDFLKDQEEPLLIWLPMGTEEYDIVYVEEGSERIVSNRLKRLNLDTNYLVIIEHIGQLEHLSIENMSAVYLAKDGELEYVK